MADVGGRLARGWTKLAIVVFNTLILVLVLNILAAIAVRWIEGREDPLPYSEDLLDDAYPGRSRSEIRELLSETWNREYAYEPFTQFKEGSIEGRFVNVGPEGFRVGTQGWPPAPRQAPIFVFGGSTTFGYGVDDAETIPESLGRALARRGCGDSLPVYNLARSNYFSTQERTLFEKLLAEGLVPRAAVFIDGLNEFMFEDGEPKYTRRLSHLMAETDSQQRRRSIKALPLVRLLKALRPGVEDEGSIPVSDEKVEEILVRWQANRRLIRAAAADFGVETFFVWQPIPVYGYDLESHPFAQIGKPLLPQHDLLQRGYEEMARRRQDPASSDFEDLLWLADLQRGRREPLYVDRVHYTAAFAAEIGDAVAQALAPRLCPVPDEAIGEEATESAL